MLRARNHIQLCYQGCNQLKNPLQGISWRAVAQRGKQIEKKRRASVHCASVYQCGVPLAFVNTSTAEGFLYFHMNHRIKMYLWNAPNTSWIT
jgi:hypothetical protein